MIGSFVNYKGTSFINYLSSNFIYHITIKIVIFVVFRLEGFPYDIITLKNNFRDVWIEYIIQSLIHFTVCLNQFKNA